MQGHHPHDTGQHHYPNRPRTSSIPLPTLQTNSNSYHSNSQGQPIASPETPNATPLQYHKTRRLDYQGNATYPAPGNGVSRSFDTPASRAASGPPLTVRNATSNPAVARSKGPEKASFRDLVARFNQSQTSSTPLAPQRTERRTQSNQAESGGDRTARRREPQSALDRPSPLLSSLQSTVDRVNGTPTDHLPPKSSSEPRHSHQQGHKTRFVERSQQMPLAQDSNPPLFGEIVPGSTQWPSGYGISPLQSHQENGFDSGSLHPDRRISHSRSISDMSLPKTASLDASFPRSNGDTLHPSHAHSRSRSDHAQFAKDKEHDSKISTTSENHENARPQTPQTRSPKSRIPIPSPPRQANSPQHVSTASGESTRSLRAIINVPTPQTSPPLRSSRPRRDVHQARSVSPAADRQKWPTQESNASFGETTYRDPYAAVEEQRTRASDSTSFQISQTQLPTTTYQRPSRGLKVQIDKTPPDAIEDPPSTTATHFEDDESPDLDVPGSFPSTDDTQHHENSKDIRSLEEQDSHLGRQEHEDWTQYQNHSRTVLSQIMEMRRNHETGQLPNATFADLRSSLGTDTDAGTIQIMLGDVPMAQPSDTGWVGRDNHNHQTVRDTSAEDTAASHRNTENLSPSPYAMSMNEDDASDRLTPDGDYSAINRILDQYHQSGVISPAMVSDFQQYILDVEPELLGDDEAEKENVAKVALEDIIRDHAFSNDLSSTGGAEESASHHLDHDATIGKRPSFEASANELTPGAFGQDLQAHAGDAKLKLRDLYDSIPDVVAPTPPLKDQLPLPAASISHSFPPDLSHEPEHSSSARLSVETPLLPPTPSTGGSIGFSPVTGGPNDILRQDAEPESNLHAPVPILERTQSAPPPETNSTDDQEPTPTVDSRPSVDAQDAAVSTPARSMQGARSFSETDHTPSSKTSLTDSTLVVAETPSRSPPLRDAEQKRLNRRRQVLKELLDTEASYLQDMRVVEDIYKQTSKSCETVTSEDRRVLFGNCATIITFSETFLSALKKATVPVYLLPRQTKWRTDQNRRSSFSTSNSAGATDEASTMGSDATDDDRDRKTFVGDVFNQNMARIEAVYTDYLKNHDSANQRLKKMQDIPRTKLWLQECQNYAADITAAWDLDSLLVKPVQRVLKYPLLLKALIETTPESHPDYAALRKAEKNMAEAAVRINDSKKRAEVLEQIMSNTKRRDFDISKLLGRRTDKLRQQVGLSDAVDDAEYRMLAQKFETRYVHLQIVLRDFELYKEQTGRFMDNLMRLMSTVEEMVSVGHTNSPELESKWRKVVMTFRDVHSIAFTDHESAVSKRCVEPIVEVIKLYEGPQKIMMKRKKRVVEYAKYTTAKNKGEKLDKRTIEQGEQFLALNETLKFELPKLFDLSNKLIWACVRNFVDLQVQWNSIWQRKARTVLEEQPDETPTIFDIVDAFNSDFNYVEAHVLSLGICNGALLNDVSNYLASSSASFSTTETTTRPSLTRSSATSTGNQSPRIPAPDFDRRSGSFTMPSFSGRTSSESQNRPQQQHGQSYYQERFRASSNVSNSSKNAARSDTPKANTPYVPHQESRQQRTWETRPSQPTQSQSQQELVPDTRVATTPAYARALNNDRPPSRSPASGKQASNSPNLGQQKQKSSAFSSAMPWSNSATTTRPASPATRSGKRERKTQYQTLYTAASLYDFNLDDQRTEAGYPYLYYTPGEIFDIIGTKGELWLAKNQDDSTETIGWVWERHFAKLMPTET